MRFLSKYKNKIWFLLRTIDMFSKYSWVSFLKDKKTNLPMHFKKGLHESDVKPKMLLKVNSTKNHLNYD